MKNCIPFLYTIYFLFGICFYATSQQEVGYQYSVDLTRAKNGKLSVDLLVPKIKENATTFHLPRILPGIYSIVDYGRFISDFNAFDINGNQLITERKSTNSWEIKGANRLYKVSYLVEGSFNSNLAEPNIFAPAGTNIEANKNFTINPAGLFGYFERRKDLPFEIAFTHTKDMYGSTGLIALSKNSKRKTNNEAPIDSYLADGYDKLVDSPFMYSKPDTAIINLGTTEVLVSSYSPNHKISAKEIAASIRDVLIAQQNYIKGKLPIKKFAFIFYFSNDQLSINSFGSLEHGNSSLYYLQESGIEEIRQQLRDLVSHDFFHSVIPRTIHSEKINHFDFENPKMSMHLWLYEGVNEYLAGNMQVKNGFISVEEYLNMLRQKMQYLDRFKDTVSITNISKFVIDKYPEFYNQVYQKGALIGLCLDLQLYRLSEGKYGIRELIQDLATRYGPSKSFIDEELFEVIEKITYPQIGTFLKTYVGGTKKLPLKEIFMLAGVNYHEIDTTYEYSIGLTDRALKSIPVNGTSKMCIKEINYLDDQGKRLGFLNGDVILKLNGQEFPSLRSELPAYFEKHKKKLNTTTSLEYSVVRRNDQGKLVNVDLASQAIKIQTIQRHALVFEEKTDKMTAKIRILWLK
ncbi:peptidase M61 [soil metagenome]